MNKGTTIDVPTFQKVVDIFVRLHTLPKEEQVRQQKLTEFR